LGIKETDIWLNKSRSGKALNFGISGIRYTIAVTTLERLIKGEINGLKLGEFIPDPEKQAEYKQERAGKLADASA